MSDKSKKVSKAFLILDIGVSVLIPISYTCFSIVADAMISDQPPDDNRHFTTRKNKIFTVSLLFTSAIDTIISTIFAISAGCLAKLARNETGKKQNNCLVSWHMVNSLISVFYAIFQYFIVI